MCFLAFDCWLGVSLNSAAERLQKLGGRRSTNRAVRSLVHLSANASTARTLNLITVWERWGQDADYARLPFFESPVLNRSIIVKHRLRHYERDTFQFDRSSATKVILPIDPTDLNVGARSFFVGQKGYEVFLEELAAATTASAAMTTGCCGCWTPLPSLDPFLMRERLKKEGFSPARCYFDLTDADMVRMFQFVRDEVAPLIGMSFGDVSALNEKTGKLATKILANASDAELEPLRQGLDMSKPDFEEGIFCWKGFIYYKWTLGDLLPRVRPVAAQLSSIKPTGLMTDDERELHPAGAGAAGEIDRAVVRDRADDAEGLRGRLRRPHQARPAAGVPRVPAEGADPVQRTGRAPGRRPPHRQLLGLPLPGRRTRPGQLGGAVRPAGRLRSQPRTGTPRRRAASDLRAQIPMQT